MKVEHEPDRLRPSKARLAERRHVARLQPADPLLVLLKAQFEDRWLGLYERIKLIRPAGDPRSPLGYLVGRLDAAISPGVAFEKRERVVA